MRDEYTWELKNAFIEEINNQGTTIIMATHNSQIVNERPHRLLAIENAHIARDEAKGVYEFEA